MKSPFVRVVEVCVLSGITTSFAFWLPYLLGPQCYYKPENPVPLAGHYSEKWDFLVQYNCPTGSFSPVATLFFNTEGTVIKALVSGISFEDNVS